ncbi:tape measure protein [Acinetobacter baumannii]|uniref:tape measure protein n=1 Tax=Acinetobacter baumannii TaxID=470 RepID=UPI000AFF2359|nr:tape measure protein [Acinetobacter baumannii]MBK6067246.1 tape measure protein [Acinetobacter baumannii]MCA4444144.1 tape measure protein [Acinetobacter baumannii]NDY15617.1 tape measure protein [Acinetobacter baumannii]TDI42245.1 phage tail tape measure protein [Acinetobacter baumannii]WKA72801.1 tape measure protein [Acinetobacter baumannii]
MAQESRLVIVIDSKNAERNARNLGNELDSIERKGDFATKSMDSLSVATRQLAGYMAGLVTVSAAISKMDTYTGLQNRLKLVTNNQVELNKATEDTFRIAQKTYSAWDSVLQVYQRFSDNAKTLNLTMDDTARLTETVSKAVAISGASAQAADAALVQFGQALASGTLRGEELNSVMEQTPALAKAIAQGMGITVGELRSVAAEGKITSQEIVKALRNVEKDVDALFAKTDITIGQSLTLLNNEITKFVGESGKGSGAAQVLAGTIQTLASNLDVLTSAMMVGGAYWLGTYIPAIYASGVAVVAKTKELAAQTVTQYAAIQAERAAAAQEVINTQAVVANTQATLAAIAAEKALEVQRLKSQITEKGRTATLTRMAELKKIEAQVTRELALAEEALAVAQSRSAAAGAASVGIGSRLLGLLGGPVGIGITVASLAAGYLLMRNNGDKANDMLEKQSRYAGMAADELMKLEGAQKRAAEGELTKQLNLQNAQLSKSQNEFLLLTQSIADNNKQSAEAYRIWAELKTGVIDVNQAFNRLNQLSFISSDQINQLTDSKKKVDENSKAVKQTNSELNQVRTSGANAKAGFNDVSQGAKGAVQDVTELNKKLKDINKSLSDRKWDADFKSVLINKYGRSAEEAELLLQTYRDNQKKGFAGVTVEQDKIIKGIVSQESALDELVNKDKQRTKELEKQQKVLAVNAKIQANAAKYGFAAIESKYNLPAGTLSAIHAIETGNTGRTDQVNKSTGATGGFQFLEGTAKQYGVKNRKDLAQSAEGAGKYMSYLLKLFKGDLEQAVRAYHAGEGNVQKGKGIGKYNNQYWKDFQGYMAGINGYTSGDISSKDFDKLLQDATKMAEEQAKLRLQLENDIANEVTKIRNDLAKKLEDVDKANFTPERKAEITAELQARADNDIAIAEQALKTKLDDYKQFNLTEEQLLKESFDRKKFTAAHDIELSKDQRDKAIKYLDQQYQHELELINLTKAARQSAYDQANLKALLELKQERDILAAPIGQRAGLSLQFGERNALAENDATLINKGADLKVQLEQKEITTLEYNKRIEDAVRIHEENKFKIQEEYAEKYKDLQNTQYESQLGLYNSLLSQASTVWGGVTQIVKDSAGEQSGAYKAMFLVQQAIAMSTATIQAYQAYSNVLANAPYPLNMTMAPIALGLGMANVGLIAAQTIAGFSDGGYTGNGLKHTPAGIVHKGEVVWSQEDIKRWGGVSVVESMRQSKPSGYANGGYVSNNTTDVIATRREARQFDAINSNQTQSSSSDIPINVYVTVNADGSSKTDTQNDSKQLGQMIGNAVRTIIRQEQRQGGLLSK